MRDFLYVEDVDICMRNKARWQYRDVIIDHAGREKSHRSFSIHLPLESLLNFYVSELGKQK